MKSGPKIIIGAVLTVLLVTGGFWGWNTYGTEARVQAKMELAVKYLSENKFEEAILAYNEAIKIDPRNIEARVGLAQAYIGIGDFQKAEEAVTTARGIGSIVPEQYQKLITAYIKQGRLTEAERLLAEAREKYADNAFIADVVKQYNAELDAARAISTSKDFYEQGIRQMNDKQYLPAVDSFQKVLQEDADRYADAQSKITDCKKAFVDVALQKAKDAAANNDYKTALDLIEQVLKVDPSNQDALKLFNDYSVANQNNGDFSQISLEIKNEHEIWVQYPDGHKDLLVNTQGYIGNPQFSLDGTKVYYTVSAYTAASSNTYVVNIKDKIAKHIIYGSFVEVINEGEYKGNIIVSQHKYYGPPNYGSYDEKCVVDDNGNILAKLN